MINLNDGIKELERAARLAKSVPDNPLRRAAYLGARKPG
jgi:hypothetical protein